MRAIYPEHFYDKDGYLKPPKRYYLAIIYLIRGYFIIIMASSLGAKTQAILSVFYPQPVFIYLQLLVGLPAIVAWIILSYRVRLREIGKGHYLKLVKPLLLVGLLTDFIIHVYMAFLTHWSFYWPVALGVIVPVYGVFLLITKTRLLEDQAKAGGP